MPKLQRQKVEKGGKVYSRYWITIPSAIIDALCWMDVDELKLEIQDGKIVVIPWLWKKKAK